MSFVAECLKALLPEHSLFGIEGVICIMKDYLYFEEIDDEELSCMERFQDPDIPPDIYVGGFIPYWFFERLGRLNSNKDLEETGEHSTSIDRYNAWRDCKTIESLIHRESYLTTFFHDIHMVNTFFSIK